MQTDTQVSTFLRKPVPGFGFELLENQAPERKICKQFDSDAMYQDLSRWVEGVYEESPPIDDVIVFMPLPSTCGAPS